MERRHEERRWACASRLPGSALTKGLPRHARPHLCGPHVQNAYAGVSRVARVGYSPVMVEGLKPPARWLSSYWDEDDILFYFEADEDGVVLRQVESKGPSRTPIAAGSLAELPDARIVGSAPVAEYYQRWGGIADQPIPVWGEDFPHEDITADEFEAVWQRARRAMS